MSAPLLHHSRSQPSHYDRNGLRTRSWADRAAVHASPTCGSTGMPLPSTKNTSAQRPAPHDRPLRHVKSTVASEHERERAFPTVSPSTHSLTRMKSVSYTDPTSPLESDVRGRRERTSSAVAGPPLSPKSSTSILQPKRWSALLHWRSANGGHKGSARHRDVNARFSHSSAFPVPDLPKEIGTPFNIIAAPGSALDRAIQSQDSRKTFGLEAGEKNLTQSSSATQMSKISPPAGIERTLPVRASKMESADDVYVITHGTPKFKSVHRKPVSVSDMKRSRSATVTQGEVKVSRPPMDLPERTLNESQAPICNPTDEVHVAVAVGNVSEQSLYTLATDKSFFSEEQSYSTCPTPALDAASSEEGGSTPALTNEDGFGRSPIMTAQQVFHSPASLNRSLSRGRLSDKGAFQQIHMHQTFEHQQHTQAHAYTVDCGLPSLRPGITDEAEASKWRTPPRGLQIEGEDLTNELKLLLVDETKQDRQARLYAWRHHAKPQGHEYAQTSREQWSHLAHGELPNRLEPKASIVDFAHVAKGALVEREPYSSSYAEVGDFCDGAGDSKVNDSKNDCEEVTGRSSLASESLLDNYADSVEIRTAWREEIQHLRLKELTKSARASTTFSSDKRNVSPSTVSTIRDLDTPSQSGRADIRSRYGSSYSPERSPVKATSSLDALSSLHDNEQNENDICSHLLRRDREHRRYAVHE